MAVLGVGGVIPLQRKHLLRAFDLTDHLTRTPLSDAVTTTSVAATGNVMTTRAEGMEDSRDGISLTSNMRLTVGLTIPLRLTTVQQ
jgi:hypothetical protein